jgi:hypothetical protein
MTRKNVKYWLLFPRSWRLCFFHLLSPAYGLRELGGRQNNFEVQSIAAYVSLRIILDEIHSIGQQEGGAVWEQIILLAPCPIM